MQNRSKEKEQQLTLILYKVGFTW